MISVLLGLMGLWIFILLLLSDTGNVILMWFGMIWVCWVLHINLWISFILLGLYLHYWNKFTRWLGL